MRLAHRNPVLSSSRVNTPPVHTEPSRNPPSTAAPATALRNPLPCFFAAVPEPDVAEFDHRRQLLRRSLPGAMPELTTIFSPSLKRSPHVVNWDRAADHGRNGDRHILAAAAQIDLHGFSPLRLSHLSIHFAVPVTGMSSPLKATISS
jgi:hypothetical protein